MKLAVFGATGGTGRCLIEQALVQGHEVTAFARNPSAMTLQHEKLSIVQGDVLDPARVEAAAGGKDAVLCALGTPNRSGTTVLSTGTKNILAAMEKLGVRRLVCETTLGLGDSKAEAGFFYLHVLVPLAFKHVFADKQRQEQLIEQSGLDWVIVRPSRLTDGPRTAVYRTGLHLKLSPLGAKISRADVADFMLKQVTNTTWLRKAVGISY
jgi:putative NADH-flavin reductase